MRDEDLIRAYLKRKTASGAAAELGIPAYRAGNRIRRLRQYGVRIPKFSYTGLTSAEVSELNSLIEEIGAHDVR